MVRVHRHYQKRPSREKPQANFNPEVSQGLLAILLFIIAGLSVLSFFSIAGVAGIFIDSILALIFGFIGLHRFYLGQRGNGILYLLLAFTGISAILGLIDAFTFFSMDNKSFDIKYNRDFLRVLPKKEFDQAGKRDVGNAKHNKKGNLERANGNIHVKSGKSKFLSYDYAGAISDFSKALEINPREIAAHFNIACAYSLNENIEKALFHLDKAVLYGFDDFEKIKTHDALAFLRVQPEFMLFSNNNFRLSGNNIKNEPLLNTENIEKLEQLRLRGLLTDEEFNVQKMKISRL